MNLVECYRGRTILGVGAHPDDLEISAGGTMARLVQSGARVVMAAVAIPSHLEVRMAEAQAATSLIGAELDIVERERCRRVEDFPTYELVSRLDRLVKQYEPAAIFTHSADEVHQDHLLIHRAVLSTLRLRAMDVYFFAPSSCKPLLQSWQPRLWVDIASTIDHKIGAIAAHRSQFGDRGLCVDIFREQARSRGLPVGFGYAEGFDPLCLRA